MCSTRTLTRALIACFVLLMFSGAFASAAFAQDGVVLPGGWTSGGACYTQLPTDDAFQIIYQGLTGVCAIPDAALRLTLGGSTDAPIFGQLGVVDTAHYYFTLGNSGWFSKIAPMDATVLRSSEGDLVLSATTFIGTPSHGPIPPTAASIRFGTTPYQATDTVLHPNDIERMTLWGNGKLAVGTQGMPDSVIYGDNLVRGENDLFHLHLPCLPTNYLVDPSSGYDTNQLMSLKLSYGLITSPQLMFAQLGFDRGHQLAGFGNDEDLVLSTNSDVTDGPTGSGRGDIVITNRRIGRAIRFGTTYDSDAYPSPDIDQERLTIAANGNVGIDLPKDSATGLSIPLDQVQIGGGSVAPPGYSTPIPGLTMYGGNPLEGTRLPNGDTAPVDWRGIAFNHYEDHLTGIGYREAPMAWSGIGFSEANGGLVNIGATPWLAGDSLTGDAGGVTLQLQGNTGLYLWSDDRAIGGSQYHHLFEVWRKGYDGGIGLPNDSGIFLHHTPVYIGGTDDAEFANLANVHPLTGDGKTWMLAVDGPAIVRELYVDDSDWPDYVLLPDYKLMTIQKFGAFMELNHHLPDLPDAKTMENRVPVGRTEEAMTKQMEEMGLYIVQLNKEVEALKSEVQEMKNQGGK